MGFSFHAGGMSVLVCASFRSVVNHASKFQTVFTVAFVVARFSKLEPTLIDFDKIIPGENFASKVN